MLTQEQNTVVFLMFLNGILFLGLNYIARSIINPQNPKKRGYVSILAAVLVLCVQQEYRAFIAFGIEPGKTAKLLLGGFVVPVFLISLVYHRLQKNRKQNSNNQP